MAVSELNVLRNRTSTSCPAGIVPGADSLTVVGLLGACEPTWDVRGGSDVLARVLPLLAQATLAMAVATVSARAFNIGFICITSWHLLVQRTYRHISNELRERRASEVVRAEGVADDAWKGRGSKQNLPTADVASAVVFNCGELNGYCACSG